MQSIFNHFRNIIHTSTKPTVLEFGSCDGYHSNIMLQELSKLGKPYYFAGFEAEPFNYELCKKYNQKYLSEDVRFHMVAVGEAPGEMKFHVSYGEKRENGNIIDRYYGSSSLLAPKLVLTGWPDMRFRTITVDVTTLSEYHQNRNLGIIDFIWCDVQGAEAAIVKGSYETFKKHVRYFYTEINHSELYEGTVVYDDFLKLMPDFEVVEYYGGDVLLKNKLLN